MKIIPKIDIPEWYRPYHFKIVNTGYFNVKIVGYDKTRSSETRNPCLVGKVQSHNGNHGWIIDDIDEKNFVMFEKIDYNKRYWYVSEYLII